MLSTSKTQISRLCLLDLCWIALLLGVFYAILIGSHPLFTPDEGRYSEIAREMTATGDYITPRLNGVAFLDKPILYYWLQASAIQLFGLKEAALRFWPAVFGVFGCLITYLAGHLLFNRRTGILAALILATTPLYYGAAHYANLDLEVAVLISSALFCFLIGIQSKSKKTGACFLIAAYVFSALAALTKGLIGIAFPAMIIGSWILILNRWSVLKKMHLLTGIVIFFAITAPWYWLVQKANPQFFHFFFVTQQVARFLTKADFNNQTPVWFYLPIVLMGLLPWTAFVFQAITQKVRAVAGDRKKHANELFLLLWFFIIFIFFSIPKSKTIGYIIPVFPPLSLMIADYLSSVWNQKTKGLFFGAVSFILLSLAVITTCFAAPHVAGLDIQPALLPYLYFTAGTFFIAALITCFLLYRKDFNKIIYLLITVSAVFLLTFIASASIINQKSIKPLAIELNKKIKPNDELVTYFKYYQDLPLYTQRRVTVVADWLADDIPHYDNWQRELWFGMPFQDTREWLIDDKTFLSRWNSQKRLFVLMNEGFYPQFSKQIKNKIYKIAENNGVILISNQST